MSSCPGNDWRGADRRLRIVHVSADFPDVYQPAKTPVIQTLVDLTQDQFEHRVISINRVSPGPLQFIKAIIQGAGKPCIEIATQAFKDGLAVQYRAPPRGLFHATMLRQLGDWLAECLANGPRPDLIVGHKLTVEGIAVRRAAEALGIPYAISIQGNTDTKILGARPDLRGELTSIFHGAAIVFPFTPWALRQTGKKLGQRNGPIQMLPCPTDIDCPITPRETGNGLISVFHLKNYKGKNLEGMAAALRLIQQSEIAPPLSVIGGGTSEELAACKAIAGGLGNLTFAGPLDREQLRIRMNEATALVLPSLRESFGLVFVEALFSGLPIIYPADTAVDGYFDDAPFAIRVNASDPSDIAQAIQRVVREEPAMKAALKKWQQSKEPDRFTRSTIARDFAKGLITAAASAAH